MYRRTIVRSLRAYAAGCACAALLCLAIPTAWAQDKPVVNWMVLDLPPASIPVDGVPTDGFVDILLKMIFEEMPEAQHKVLVVNTARAMATLAEGQPMCFATAIQTPERERVAYFTVTQVMPPLQIVARAEVAAKLPRNDKGEVLPATLFDRSDLRGLVVPQRSYSALLDALLSRHSPGSGVRNVLAADSGANILKMLSLDRGDYTVEYDYILNYQQKRNPDLLQSQKLKAFPIAGMAPIPVGIACPHTEWGRATIQRVDAIASKISASAEYRNALNRWLSPESAARFQKTQNDFYRQRAKPSAPDKYPRWVSSQ